MSIEGAAKNSDAESRAAEQLIRTFEEQICREERAEFNWQQAENEILAERSEDTDD